MNIYKTVTRALSTVYFVVNVCRMMQQQTAKRFDKKSLQTVCKKCQRPMSAFVNVCYFHNRRVYCSFIIIFKTPTWIMVNTDDCLQSEPDLRQCGGVWQDASVQSW